MKTRPVLLFLLSLTVARADHGNLASFNEVTSRWFGVAKTPVLNETVETSWAPDGSVLLYALDTAEGKRLMKLDPARGKAIFGEAAHH